VTDFFKQDNRFVFSWKLDTHLPAELPIMVNLFYTRYLNVSFSMLVHETFENTSVLQ